MFYDDDDLILWVGFYKEGEHPHRILPELRVRNFMFLAPDDQEVAEQWYKSLLPPRATEIGFRKSKPDERPGNINS